MEFQRDDMQRIIRITETLSHHNVNYHFGFHDRVSLVNSCGTGDIRYRYDHHDGPADPGPFHPPVLDTEVPCNAGRRSTGAV